MNSKLLSIIIPYYNATAYLNRSLDSIYEQGLPESSYEVIAVDDGSTDSSSEIIKQYQAVHNNLVLIKKNNGGVSSARNIGLSVAIGKYVVFLDADDVLISGSMQSLVKYISQNQSEIIVMRTISDKGENYPWCHLYKDGDVSTAIDSINKGFVRGSVCGCAFLLVFLQNNDILFPEGVRNGEDTIFFFSALALAVKVVFKDILFYRVINNIQSASNTYSLDRLLSSVYSLNVVEAIIMKQDDDRNIYVWNFLKYILISNIISSSISDPNSSYKQLCKYNVDKYQKINTGTIITNRLKIRILNTSFFAFYFMANIKRKLFTLCN